jgi:hypothetical protein
MKKTPAQIQAILQFLHERANCHIEEFKTALNENPHHALEWSMQAFSAAGILRHTTWMLELLKPENIAKNGAPNFENMARTMLNTVRHGAKSPARSTSVTGNLLSQETVAGAETILEDAFGIRIDELPVDKL